MSGEPESKSPYNRPGMRRLTIYNKLVRDGMPDIIAADGHRAAFRTLAPEEFRHELKRKLVEEVIEYLESDDPREMADIYAVLIELAFEHDDSGGFRAVEKLQQEKHRERGSFDKRLFLLFVERPEIAEEKRRDEPARI